MKFRHVLIFSLILFASENVVAESPVDIFREGALILIESVDLKSESGLIDASEILSSVDPSEIIDFSISSGEDSISDPYLMFNSDFCNKTIIENFTLVAMNPLNALRDISGHVSTVTRTIAANASVEFQFEGEDEMTAAVVWQIPDSIKTIISAEGEAIYPSMDNSGKAATFSWTQSPGDSRFSMNIHNSSSSPQTFVIAFE